MQLGQKPSPQDQHHFPCKQYVRQEILMTWRDWWFWIFFCLLWLHCISLWFSVRSHALRYAVRGADVACIRGSYKWSDVTFPHARTGSHGGPLATAGQPPGGQQASKLVGEHKRKFAAGDRGVDRPRSLYTKHPHRPSLIGHPSQLQKDAKKWL